MRSGAPAGNRHDHNACSNHVGHREASRAESVEYDAMRPKPAGDAGSPMTGAIDAVRRPRWAVITAMALLAGAVMLFEIALTRIFSFTIWHHFAFMVISIALLGFGISGVVLHLRPRLGRPPLRGAAWCAAGFAGFAILAVLVLTRLPFDPSQIAVQRVQLLYLLLYYVVLLVPFVLAGLALVVLLNGFAGAVNILYASDLIGAGLGCLLSIAAMRWIGADGVLWGAAVTAATAACLLRYTHESGTLHRPRVWLALPGALILSLPVAPRLLSIPPGPSKALTGWLDARRFPEARLVHTEWNALARIDVVEGSGTVRWTANPQVGVALPPQTQIVIDGDAATPIVAAQSDLTFLDYMLPSSALQAFRPVRVLVIGAGGGIDVLAALRHAQWSGQVFARPEVRLHVAEGRAFVRRAAERFDLITLSLVDTWAASASGAYSLAEAYLYTVEAFTDYLSHLSDQGVLTITRWLWSPPRETLKLCTVAVAALQRLGVSHPEQHVVVLALGRLGNVLVKRSPFTAADLAALQQVAAARRFEFLYAPGAAGTNEFVDFLAASDREGWMDAYVYDVRPATDDRPFFFQFGRWRAASLFGAGWREGMLALSGRLVLLATGVQALALSVLLLIVPVVWRRRLPTRLRAGGVVLYFSAIGVSFMLLEVSLMQRFTLFLGHPVYALAAVLAVLLMTAGLGSMSSDQLCPEGRRVWLVFAGIVGLSVAYADFLPVVFDATLGYGLWVRIAVTTGLLAPFGVLLGVPFPIAIRHLAAHGDTPLVPWAWAANGCASVLGPVLAVMIAMDFGFRAVGWGAGLGYLVAFVAFRRWTAASV
jgi:hypothetical protein